MAKLTINGVETEIAPFTFTACGTELTFNADDYNPESILELLAYGAGRKYQDRANSFAFKAREKGVELNGVKIKRELTPAEKEAYVTAEFEAHKLAPFGDARGSGGGGLSDVESTAFNLAGKVLVKALGLKKRDQLVGNAKAVSSVTGEPYARTTKGGSFVWVAESMRAFIAANPDGEFMARAQTMVDAAKPKAITVKL